MLNKDELTVAKQVLDIVGGAEGYLKEVKKSSMQHFCSNFREFHSLWNRAFSWKYLLTTIATKYLTVSANTEDTIGDCSLFLSYDDDCTIIRYKFLKWLEQQV